VRQKRFLTEWQIQGTGVRWICTQLSLQPKGTESARASIPCPPIRGN
jgi:hypothetical protein